MQLLQGSQSIANHIIWQFRYFDEHMINQDLKLAVVPRKHLLHFIECGIAPPMKADGEKSYWGADLDEAIDEKTKVILGRNIELHKRGQNVDEAQGRIEATQILQDPHRNGRNARQAMSMHKQAHGSREYLDLHDSDQIKEAMEGHGPKHMVPMFGDGSHTAPTKWWAALGGYRVWVPSWNRNAEVIEAREEENYSRGAIGQTGSSTRQEFIAWILDLGSFFTHT